MRILAKRRQELLDRLAPLVCPYKVGQIVESWPGVSHAGRHVRVTGVFLREGWHDNLEWRATGIVLKKDGSDSAVRTHVDQWMLERPGT